MLTAFKMLTGQGEALNIDPLKFYQHLYKVLFQLDAGECKNYVDENVLVIVSNIFVGKSREDIRLTIECLDAMLAKRKRQVRNNSVFVLLENLYLTLCKVVLCM